ncbi:hypothetical protein CLCR_04261 [Cladophialophora carrionii]|uniref:NAD dependent epimerase/dehydratase n=1 Tax=Cladophialophora carrionii TaxID=86049 RepID=A0A1C1CIU0_9EURO|nr:hypothetical protein CLCR_04261 [Cladophialophora carrionii]
MARTVDKLPDPPTSPKVKLIVASCSRTATLGVYQALKILGYRPYHLYELCMVGGDPHWETLIQGMHARHDRLSSPTCQPPYTKREFDRWFAGYDAVVEVPAFFGTDCLEAYAADPEVKFILTERTARSWARSFNGFCGGIVRAIEKPPLSILRHFSRTLNYFCVMNVDVYNLWSDSTRPGDSRNEEALMRNYERYIRDVKRVIPPERMLVAKLEDGLGWEKICAYLGKDVPKDVPFPRAVNHEDVKDKWMWPVMRDATTKFVLTVTLPVVLGMSVWWMRSGSS